VARAGSRFSLYPLRWPEHCALSPGGQGIAFLNFIPAGRPVPDSSIGGGSSEGDFVFDLALPMEDYTAIVDLVRNETPIRFAFDDTDPNGWSVRTGSEEVGEDQGK
jgi:hypothetical protein